MAGHPLAFSWIEFTMEKNFGEHNTFGIDTTFDFDGLQYIEIYDTVSFSL